MEAFRYNLDVFFGTGFDVVDGTFEQFKASAPNGTVGAFVAPGGAKYAGSGSFFLAKKQKDGNVRTSEVIDPTKTRVGINDSPTIAAGKGFSCLPYQHVIGHNGTAGTIDLTNGAAVGEDFRLQVRVNNYGSLSPLDFTVISASYLRKTGDTAADVAIGVAGELNANFAKLALGTAERTFWAYPVSAAAGTAVVGTGNVVSGSNIINLTGHGAVAGDFIKLINATQALSYNATAATQADLLYKVVRVIDANNIVVDKPYLGASSVIASNQAVRVTLTQARAADAGIYILGVMDLNAWRLGFVVERNLIPVVYELRTFNFGDTPSVTQTTANSFEMAGTRLAELEWFANGMVNDQYYLSNQPVLFPYLGTVDSNANFPFFTTSAGMATFRMTSKETQLVNPTEGERVIMYAELDGALDAIDDFAGATFAERVVK